MPQAATRRRKTPQPLAAKTVSANSVLFLSATLAAILAVVFVANRESDLLQLATAAQSFTGLFGGFEASVLRDSVLGAYLVLLLAFSWFGFGSLVERALSRFGQRAENSAAWVIGCRLAYGAGLTSLLTLALGLAHLYRPVIAFAVMIAGFPFAVFASVRLWRARTPEWQRSCTSPVALLTVLPVLLAALASLSPPIAKDTLLYHISLPKAFVQGGGLVDVPLNIAQYYALGAEMNGTLAMLLGRIFNSRVAEAAFGFSQFAYLPILALLTFGWMRHRGTGFSNAGLATTLVVAVPTMYASASSAYNDVALTVCVTLAIVAATKWWGTLDLRSGLEMGLAAGLALNVKLLAVFLLAALLIVFLAKLRQVQHDSALMRTCTRTFALSLLVALLVSAPWYARTWARTGSPVFPFYINIAGGTAPGWDEQRSLIDQLSNARYGGYPKSLLDYAITPVRVSLTAQPDEPPAFDGVLGFSFLFGMPLLALAAYRKQLGSEWIVPAAIGSLWFFFWMFSSPQLRYLLPAIPALAVAIVSAVTTLDSRLRALLWATIVPALLVTFAWLAQQNPLAVLIGAESRDHYLARSIDHYGIYAEANARLPQDARVWLIDVRGDTYYIERPYLSDFRIEHTFPQLVLSSNSIDELRGRIREHNVTHLLARTDILLNYRISQLVDDKVPVGDNQRRLQLLHDFFFNGKVIARNDRFVLVEL